MVSKYVTTRAPLELGKLNESVNDVVKKFGDMVWGGEGGRCSKLDPRLKAPPAFNLLSTLNLKSLTLL